MTAAGTVFAERWEVVAPLASGSTSEVYRGLDRRSGESVALKVLRADLASNAEALQRFQREGRVALKLSHPHIVEVRDFGSHEGHAWIAMELLEGDTLEAHLGGARMPRESVLSIVEQVAAAVDCAHAAGVVHRDLKPDNVFVLAGDAVRVKVLDFGFAKLLNLLEADGLKTAANALLGTPLYMAPEQVRSSSTVDPRADLWSLGVIAYELLTGAAPFDAKATADLLVEILTKRVPPPTLVDPTLPASVDRWARRALERDAERRFANATELALALRRAFDPDEAVRAALRTQPHPAKVASPQGPPRWLIALAIAALVALAVAASRVLRS